MRILFVTQWFAPEPGLCLELAAELGRRGHEVEVITGFPNYPGGTVYDGYRVRPVQRELVEGVRVVRVPLYPSHDRSALRRLLNYASFCASAALMGPWLVRPFDVMYVYHPPGTVVVPALVLKALRRAPVVFHIQDMWPDSLVATGLASPWMETVAGWLMAAAYRWCDRIVVLSPGFRARLLERGVSPDKVSVIYNWTQAEGGECEPEASLRRRMGFDDDTFLVLHAGNIGAAQGLEAVLDGARRLRQRGERVSIAFLGDGIRRPQLEDEARASGLDNVLFLDPVPPSAVGRYLAAADALILHLKDDPLFRITIPSKLQAYLLAGRPVICGVKGDAADLVREAGAGVVCDPGDGESIAAAIGEIRRLSPEERSALGARGRRYYEEHLSVRAAAALMEREFTMALGA